MVCQALQPGAFGTSVQFVGLDTRNSDATARSFVERFGIDPAQKVADAIVWASIRPKEDLPVGWKAQGAVTAHRLFPDLTEHVAANIHRDEIAKGTANRYTCQHFPSSALGGEREMIEAVQLGTQDLVNTSTGPLGNFVPEVKIVDIPFLFRDYDHARKVMDGPIGQDLQKKMEAKGLVNLAWTENGFRHMTNSKRAINQATDASGLKMRTMENKVHMAGYKTFGLLPTPMACAGWACSVAIGFAPAKSSPTVPRARWASWRSGRTRPGPGAMASSACRGRIRNGRWSAQAKSCTSAPS